MKVLFAIAHFDKGGGQAIQALQLIRALRSQIEVHALSLTASGGGFDAAPEDGMEVVGRLRFPSGVGRLRRAIAQRMRSYDLVQALDMYYALPAARLAGAHPRAVRLGHHPIEDLGSRYGWTGRTAMRLASPWLFEGTAVVVNSQHLLEAFAPGKAHLIANGVDVDRFASPPHRRDARVALGIPLDVPLAAFTGKIVPRKNLEDLFSLLTKLSDLHLLLVGNRSEPYYGDTYYRSLTSRWPDVLDRVHAVGEVSMTAIPRYLEASDLFLFPSRLEGMPNSMLEAMAAELPVVAADFPAHRAILPEEAGLLYGNLDQLEHQVRDLIADEPRRRRMGRFGRRFVMDRFGFPAAASAYVGLYRSLLGES